MTTKTIVFLLKYFIEQKEFFLYPHKKINDLFDVILFKQIWFKQYFIDFIPGDTFLKGDTPYQKSIIYNPYHEIKLHNRFRKLFFYRILVLEEGVTDEASKELEELYDWLNKEKINITLIILDLHAKKCIPLYSNFHDTEQVDLFIQQRIPTLSDEPDGPVDLLETERNTKQRLGYYLGNKKPYITFVLVALNILFFMYMSLRGSTTDIYQLIKFGAKYNPLVATGEYYRLITSMFIHIGAIHLLFNCYALKNLGKDVELIYGPGKFTFIYLLSGIFGSIGSFIFSKAVSAGASGAIFGLMGAYLYFGLRRPAIFSARYGMNLITLLMINIFFGLTNQNIDNFAHLGGLIGGYLASFSVGINQEKIFEKRRFKIQLLTLILVASSFFYGLHIQQQTWEYDLHKGLKYLQQHDLPHAKAQFEKGLTKTATSPDLYYYLAYIENTQGNKSLAINYLKQALTLDPHDTLAQKFLNQLQNK